MMLVTIGGLQNSLAASSRQQMWCQKHQELGTCGDRVQRDRGEKELGWWWHSEVPSAVR